MTKAILVEDMGGYYNIHPNAEPEDWQEVRYEADDVQWIEGLWGWQPWRNAYRVTIGEQGDPGRHTLTYFVAGGRPDYTRYVHQYQRDGETWYAVAEWDQDRGQYICPLDRTDAKLTGCFAKSARRPWGVDHYRDRRRALRRARYLFGPESDPDFLRD